jgi:hypothetical protein
MLRYASAFGESLLGQSSFTAEILEIMPALAVLETLFERHQRINSR